MISRKKPLSRSATTKKGTPTLKRGGRPKAVNRKRKAKNHARAYGDKRAWIVLQDCAVCGFHAPSEPAHTSGDGGAGYKSSKKHLVPLCPPHDEPAPGYAEGVAVISLIGCHRESHQGVETFEHVHGVSLVELAAEYEARWQVFSGVQPTTGTDPE